MTFQIINDMPANIEYSCSNLSFNSNDMKNIIQQMLFKQTSQIEDSISDLLKEEDFYCYRN